jgi:hypothetical protein
MSEEETAQTFKAWTTYQGLYLHFTSGYDFKKYSGKGKWNNMESMEKSFAKHETNGLYSSQRMIFKKLGSNFESKSELIFFFLSQFTAGKNYPSVFDSELFEEYKHKMNNFNQQVAYDVEEIKIYMEEYKQEFNELFVVDGINHPGIMKLILSESITLETFTVLDIILKFTNRIDLRLGDPLWQKLSKLSKDYRPFLSVDLHGLASMILHKLTGAK